MSEPRFRVSLLNFAALPQFGPGHLLSRLAKGEPAGKGFPLLQSGAASELSASPFMNTARLAGILSESNPQYGGSALGGAEADAPVRFVVAGQQAGLLTGPLYTFLKAVTIIRLAKDLESSTGVCHLPLFWMASEDHDIIEVNRFSLGGRHFVAGDPAENTPALRPQVATIPLEPYKDAILRFLDKNLPGEQQNRDFVINRIAECSFKTYATLFHDLMTGLFHEHDLAVADPLALRPLTAPVLAALVEKWPDVSASFEEGSARLREEGFEPPLAEPGFFEIREGMRVKAGVSTAGVRLSSGSCSFDEAAERIRRNPGSFSPDAALRPVLQDAVIPAGAFVAGPSELLYLRQIDPVYKVIGVRRAPLRPRVSATFVDPKTARTARKLGLEKENLFEVRRLLGEYQNPPAEDDADLAGLKEAGGRLLDLLDGLLEKRESKGLLRSRNTLAGHLKKITSRIRKIKSEESGRGRDILEKTAAAILPKGKFQERAINVFELVARLGPRFPDRAVELLDPWEIAHHLVEIEP